MNLPKDYIAELKCGMGLTLITKHMEKDTKLKFVIYIYEVEE